MTSILSNIKKRFSIKPTAANIQQLDDQDEIKQLVQQQDKTKKDNIQNSSVGAQTIQSNKRKKSDSDNEDEEEDEDEEYNDSENSDQENEKVKKSVSFKEQPKQQTTNTLNKQLSAIPKSKRKSIIIQPTSSLANTNHIDTTTTRDIGNVTNQPLPPISKKPTLTNLQISEIYANCIKLSTENKINQKNSWSLNLIDHFDDVLENQHTGNTNTTNFQAASCVLDASVKIYSNRVDSVHVDTYKILGGLSRAERDESKNDDDDDESNKDTDGKNEESKNKRKKKKSGVNTLESNIDNISIKKFDLQFMVDPLFGKTSAAFDEGGAKGLLLNNLSIYGDCKLVFDSNDAIYNKDNSNSNNTTPTPTPTPINNEKVNISHWKHLFTTGSNNQLEICPTFCGFSDWSVKSQAGLSFNIDSLLKKKSKSDDESDKLKTTINNNGDENFLNMDSHGGGNNADDDNQQNTNKDDEIDLNKISSNFEDGYMGANFGNDDNNDDDGIGLAYDDDDGGSNKNNNNNLNNDDLMGILDTNQDWDQLNLVEPNQNTNWNGPEHWKFSKKQSKKKAVTGDGSEDAGGEAETADGTTVDGKKKKRKSPKKKEFLLDFDSAPPPESMFEPGKGSTLTAASLKKASETSTILPPDIHYDIKMLSRLFNKPKCSIPPMSKRDEVLKLLRPRGISSGNRNNGGGDGDLDDDDDNGMGGGNQDYDFPNSQILQDDYKPTNRGGDDDDYGDFGGGIGDWGDDGRPTNNNLDINSNGINNNNNNMNIGNQPFTIGLNGGVLIEEPKKVNKIEINYAKVSKKIDVKSLKTSVWSIIESDKSNNNNNINNNNNNKVNKESNDDHSFGSLIDNLKEEQNQLKINNKPTAGEISIPLAFICVLHLANEKNLSLNQNNINDFFISK